MSLKIIMPCAGLGSRFGMKGYEKPKPLIDAGGKPIVQLAIESLRPKSEPHQFVFIVQKRHVIDFQIDRVLRMIEPDCELVVIDRLTEGSGISIMAASHLFYNHEIILSVCDAVHLIDMDKFIYEARKHDGMMATFEDTEPKWCYTLLDRKGKFVRVKEKEAISTHANSGIWYFKRGLDLLSAMNSVIRSNERVNNEYYVTHAYNHMGSKDIGIYGAGFIPLGVPEELESYVAGKHKEYK